jgi:hypothetical protein
MGGFYERLVGTVKRALRKTLGSACLSLTQLQTVITEIAAVVNSRPLVYVHSTSNETVLTPAHLMFKNPKLGVPDMLTREEPAHKPRNLPEELLSFWKRGLHVLNLFWNIWKGQNLLSWVQNQNSVTIL